MDGKPCVGVYRDGDGWVSVEERHYPRHRLVVCELKWSSQSLFGGRLVRADDKTPELTKEVWARLERWL